MRKSAFNFPILILLAFLLADVCPAQQTTATRQQLFPVVYGKPDDGLPPTLTARGTIKQVDYASPRSCGELIFPATLKIKLDDTSRGYRHSFLYLVVPCLYRPEGAEKFLNQRIEITATKQTATKRPCFFDIGKTRINSRGLPFYCAKREELLNALMHSAVSSAKEPIDFTGTLEEGSTYRAQVIRERARDWQTVMRLKLPRHHAGRVEWLNLKEFPQLNKPQSCSLIKQFVFKVAKKEIVKVAGQYRWNTTYYCQIIAVE